VIIPATDWTYIEMGGLAASAAGLAAGLIRRKWLEVPPWAIALDGYCLMMVAH
jgi:hypothetical protein